jgi:DNA modification methylase
MGDVVTIGDATLYLGDCRELAGGLEFDMVVTDPPYPDYHVELYGSSDLSFLDAFPCRQFVFWSSRAEFPLSWTARHVWDKRKGGAGSAYEFIYERNGSAEQWVLNYVSVQNEVRANFARDEFTGHPSQKPKQLMDRIIQIAKPAGTVADFFMGSGSTGVAAVAAGKKFIGVERDEKFFDIACKRITAAQAQGRLFA